MPASADPTKATTPETGPTETTALLAPEAVPREEYQDGDHEALEDPEDKPMPTGQILLLCFASLTEPIAFFSIVPYINAMIYMTGDVPETSVGFYSGLIESLFSIVQMILMIFYGRLADRLGRKPVLVFSLTGVSIATACFGLSKTLLQMVILRCVAGLFSGSAVTVRTMLSENTTKKTQGKAFGWYSFAKNIGIFLGPIVGGGLARPADQFPGTFGHLPFFKEYPYALPTFVAGACCMIITLSSLFINETLDRDPKASASEEPPLSTMQVLRSPGVPSVLFIFGHTMVLALGYTAVAPVFQFTSIEKGGFSFKERDISLFIALGGFSQALWMLAAFPYLQRRLGTGRLFRMCAVLWPVFMAWYPMMNELLRHDMRTAFWVAAPIGIVGGSGVSMAFACVQLALNDISPSKSVLGTVNALALTVSSGVRAIAPAGFTTIFALGIKWGWADGHLAFIILTIIALGLSWAMFLLPEQAEGRPQRKENGTDE